MLKQGLEAPAGKISVLDAWPTACTGGDTRGPGHPRLVPGHAPQVPLALGLRGVVGGWHGHGASGSSLPALLPPGPGSPAFAKGCNQKPGPHHLPPAGRGSVMNAKQHMVIGLRSGGVLQGEQREKQPNGMRVPAPGLRVRPPEPGSPSSLLPTHGGAGADSSWSPVSATRGQHCMPLGLHEAEGSPDVLAGAWHSGR